jgi:hypothetical protein
MANFGISFGDPKGFADWTKYAGFDEKNPMIGIAPPSKNSKTPVAPTFGQMGTTLSNVAGQLGQGSVMGAVKAYQGLPALPVPGAPAAPVDKDGDGMISEWEE